MVINILSKPNTGMGNPCQADLALIKLQNPPRNPGGPVFIMQGEVIAIASAILTRSGGFE